MTCASCGNTALNEVMQHKPQLGAFSIKMGNGFAGVGIVPRVYSAKETGVEIR